MKLFYKQLLFLFLAQLIFIVSSAQKIEEIRFNLYTDSVKTTIDNYINVEAKLSDGRYIPLTSNDINFKSDFGFWRGNALVLNKERNLYKVNIYAELKSNPTKKINTTVYVQQHPDAGAFLTEQNFRRNQQPTRQPRYQRRNFFGNNF